MYPARVYDILMYGGALLVILGILFMISLLVMMYRWQRLIATGTRTIEYVGSSLLMPVLSLLSIFRETKKKPVKKTEQI